MPPCYDLECNFCNHEFEGVSTIAARHDHKCPECNGTTHIIFKSGPAPILFKEGWYHDVGPDPVYCATPQQLREQCDRNGNYSNYLKESSTFKTSPGRQKGEV